MLRSKIYLLNKKNVSNLTFSCIKNNCLKCFSTTKIITSNKLKENLKEIEYNDDLMKKLKAYELKIWYSSYIEENLLKIGYRHKLAAFKNFEKKKEQFFEEAQKIQPLPLVLKYFKNVNLESDIIESEKIVVKEQKVTQFPYEINTANVVSVDSVEQNDYDEENLSGLTDAEIQARSAILDTKNWMTDYDNYDDSLLEENELNITPWQVNYGTPDSNSKISNVPCGGCGALLHCKDTAIPGYIPSEIYKNFSKPGGVDLKGMICQRCHFLKFYNLALQVRVSPDDYPKVLKTISNKRALVILMIDLLDFPCSIWPGISDILSHKLPVIVVGNKVDLLPQDSPNFLKHIKKVLLNSVHEWGFAMANIKSVNLISAKSGFGVEDMITTLFSLHRKFKRDVYIVGCTNVGKSTLFNILLQSDYCKSHAADLIQRATTSPWPGTTLNLLKFPITRPAGWKQYMRFLRLKSHNQLLSQQRQLLKAQKSKNNVDRASLISYVERTSRTSEPETGDVFSVKSKETFDAIKIGIDEKDPKYALSRWCYDTPGVVQPDQIIHLLTTEELMCTLPKNLIKPRVFCLKSGSTIFLGGLGRLDYLEGHESIRFVVFCSNELPITICTLEAADEIYAEFLGTEVFKVPINSTDRMQKWPGLQPSKKLPVKGIDWGIAAVDIVLSSAGWISIAGKQEAEYIFRAWTPEKRGIHVRECLLPESVKLRGKRIRRSPAYEISFKIREVI